MPIIWDFTDASIRIPCPKKIMSCFTSYKRQEFLLLLNLYLVLPSWYCIIPALLLQHLAHQQSPIYLSEQPASLSHTFSEVDTLALYPVSYCLYALFLCYSATSSITDKSVRNLEWVRNSCYCIEVLPRELITSSCSDVLRTMHGPNESC